MVTWVGEKPKCGRCSGVAYVGVPTGLSNQFDESGDCNCLHEALDDLLLPKEQGSHNLVCGCDECGGVW